MGEDSHSRIGRKVQTMREKARIYCCLALVVSLAGLATAWGQQAAEGELTARDMFRKAAGRLVPAGANPAAPAPPAPAPSKIAPAPAPAPGPRRPAEPIPERENSPLEPTPISLREPLGLRYSLLKEVPGGGTSEVDSATVFRSGDRIRLTVATTETAYAYVVSQGSSGKWRVLFPSPEIGKGSNLIPGGVIYPIPAAHWFAFDEQVGEERLFVMISRTPVKDLDGLIYQLKESGTEPAAPGGEGPVLMAANIPPVDDSVISRLRQDVYARDLVFEKVDDSPPAQASQPVRPEKAVYVVNKTGANNSRVVADIRLQHR
jgi:hypothetical protein